MLTVEILTHDDPEEVVKRLCDMPATVGVTRIDTHEPIITLGMAVVGH